MIDVPEAVRNGFRDCVLFRNVLRLHASLVKGRCQTESDGGIPLTYNIAEGDISSMRCPDFTRRQANFIADSVRCYALSVLAALGHLSQRERQGMLLKIYLFDYKVSCFGQINKHRGGDRIYRPGNFFTED